MPNGEEEKETGQGVRLCMELADYTLENDGTKADLREKVETLLNTLYSRV